MAFPYTLHIYDNFFAPSFSRWSPKEEHSMQTALGKQLCDNVVPVMVDATMEYLSEPCNTILERVVGPADSDKFANCIQAYVLSKCHKLLVDQLGADRYMYMFFYSIKQNDFLILCTCTLSHKQ